MNRNIDKFKAYHTLFACFVSSFTICLVNLGFSLSYESQITILLWTTVILGIPHGSLDPIIVERYLLGDNLSYLSTNQIINQIVPYLSLMGLTYLFWCLVPTISLFLFILMSIYHFGEGDLITNKQIVNRPLEIFARGGNFLACISIEVTPIFSSLLDDSANLDTLVIMLHWLAMLHKLCSLYVLGSYSRNFRNNGLVALEFVTIDSLFRWCPPLLAFTIYFNLFHSVRHMLRVTEYSYARVLARGKMIILLFSLLTILPIIGFNANRILELEGSLKTIFIGLSVLTTPHMVIVSLLE